MLNMKKFNLFFAFVCVFALSTALFAQEAAQTALATQEAAPAAPAADPVIAEEDGSFPLWASITVGTDSKYVCDGIVANPDQVANLDVTIGAFGFYVDFWSQFDLTDFNDRKNRYEEADYTIGYTHTFETDFSPITVEVAWQYYQYPGEFQREWGVQDDKLVKFGISFDKLWGDDVQGIGAGTVFKYNYADNVSYGDVFASYSYQLSEKLTAGVKATFHWYDRDKMTAAVGYDHEFTRASVHGFELRPNVSYKLNDCISFSGYVACNWFINKATNDSVGSGSLSANNDKPNTWAGVSATFSF